MYTELVSKINNDTFKKLQVANKTVPLFACPEAGEHCPVHILDLYLNKLPHALIEDDVVFVKSLENALNHSTVGHPLAESRLSQKRVLRLPNLLLVWLILLPLLIKGPSLN